MKFSSFFHENENLFVILIKAAAEIIVICICLFHNGLRHFLPDFATRNTFSRPNWVNWGRNTIGFYFHVKREGKQRGLCECFNFCAKKKLRRWHCEEIVKLFSQQLERFPKYFIHVAQLAFCWPQAILLSADISRTFLRMNFTISITNFVSFLVHYPPISSIVRWIIVWEQIRFNQIQWSALKPTAFSCFVFQFFLPKGEINKL